MFEKFRCLHAYSDTKGTRLVKGQLYSLREVRRSDDGQVWAAVVEAACSHGWRRRSPSKTSPVR